MIEPAYVELHCHSCFSLLDGASTPEALVARAVELEMSALALTDHDNLYGAVRLGFRLVDGLGLPKLDLLGISALTVIADAVELVRRRHDPQFDPDRIPLDDPQTANLLAQGDTVGVFQCESEGARQTLRRLRATAQAWTAVRGARAGDFAPQPPADGCPPYCPAAAFCRHCEPKGR